MGYTTRFIGKIRITPPLNPEERAYLKAFAETRHVQRKEDAYFTNGQDEGPDSVLDANAPPDGKPALWCQWVPVDDGAALAWDGVEKFNGAEEWMTYLIEHFLQPGARAQATGDARFAGFTFDHVCGGTIFAVGEAYPDFWHLDVEDNEVDRTDFYADELPEEVVDPSGTLAQALETFARNPKAGLEQLGGFLTSVANAVGDEVELRGFLQDFAEAQPAGPRAELEALLDRVLKSFSDDDSEDDDAGD